MLKKLSLPDLLLTFWQSLFRVSKPEGANVAATFVAVTDVAVVCFCPSLVTLVAYRHYPLEEKVPIVYVGISLDHLDVNCFSVALLCSLHEGERGVNQTVWTEYRKY